tara:strand:- start:276 stop:599 length:324 start_codon:yes stop_codon:yes gene_type:complete
MELQKEEYKMWGTNMVHKSITDMRQITEEGQVFVDMRIEDPEFRIEYPVFICKREPHGTWGWVNKESEEYKIVFVIHCENCKYDKCEFYNKSGNSWCPRCKGLNYHK